MIVVMVVIFVPVIMVKKQHLILLVAMCFILTGMDDLKQDSNKIIYADEEITSQSVKLLMDVAIPESVILIEETFQQEKYQLIIYHH